MSIAKHKAKYDFLPNLYEIFFKRTHILYQTLLVNNIKYMIVNHLSLNQFVFFIL